MDAGRMLSRVYYGWILVVVLAVTETTSWGVLYYAFTVFLKPMEEELGWSRASLTGAFSLALLLAGLAGVPIGRWLDRYGPRLVMTAGSCVAAGLVLAWATVDHLITFYLVWAGLGLAMAAVLYEPAFWVTAGWFRRRQGRALTVLTFLAGFASVIYIPLAGWLVHALGWREALLVLAALLGVGTIPFHALLLRRRPEDMGLRPDGHSGPEETPGAREDRLSVPTGPALRSAAFWWLTGAFFLTSLANGAMFVHLVPYLTDRGHDAGYAAAAAGLVGVTALPGRLVLTPLGDRVARGAVAAGIFLLQTVGLVALLTLSGDLAVFGFVALFGAGFGAITPARAALVSDFYGPAHYGTISGVLGFFITGARAVAPFAAGIAYGVAGTYQPVLWTLAALSAGGAVAVLLAEASARRLVDLREREAV